eukprot:GILJ01014117.1.p1 GENE.GILJ01014117.1~~GILJ01014117.1.p1  ORF type:complete len:340 (+),score=20.95 GILJ01014117.1:39-1058(+)
MVIVVTGASGFIGGHLVEYLVKHTSNDKRIRIVVRQSSDVSHLEKLPRVEVVRGSFEDVEFLKRAVAEADYVYNCAAYCQDWGSDAMFSGTVVSTRNLMEAIGRASKIKRLLHVSTVDVYGYPQRPCDENGAWEKCDLPYCKSKRLSEMIVREYSRRYELPVTIVRPTNIYGPRSVTFVDEVVESLQMRVFPLIKNGSIDAGLLHVDDCVAGMVTAATSANTIGRIYNLGPTEYHSWNEYCNPLCDGLGYPRPWLRIPFWLMYFFGFLMESIWKILRISSRPLITRNAVLLTGRDQRFPTARIEADTQWRPRISVAEGAQTALQYYIEKFHLQPKNKKS